MRVFILILITAFALGCKEDHEPCSGKTFDPVTLPMTFGVSSDGKMLGKVTMDAEQNATFEADPGADAERLARFEADFRKHTAGGAVTYDFSDRSSDGTHHSCSASVEKGKPGYPGAFKAALYSDYFEIVDAK